MITDITDVSDKDVIEAAVRSVGGNVGVGRVFVNNLDTILCFDTPEQLMKCVQVLKQLYPDKPAPCDGNHPAPACKDPQCWQSEVPVVMHPQQVWPSIASGQVGQPVEPDTPPWMRDIAHNIAVQFVSERSNQHDLTLLIVDAMKEASREVALYFAANPGAAHA